MSRRLVVSIFFSALVAGLPAALADPVIASGAQAGQVYEPGSGVVMPTVVGEVKPGYTAEAKANRIQGSVLLSIVVQADGTVGNVEVTRSLDTKYGLDQSAVAAARQWTFKPGTRDGKPVAVRIELEMTFTLRK
ncbi:MAG: energy transducer TonB [Vicinamibacterales bacterium]|jgi:TonB family protein